MSPSKRQTPPEDVLKIVAHAWQHATCQDCGAGPGEPCTQPGGGRTVCKSRFIAAAIAIKQQAWAARQTPEQAAILASMPRVPKAEIEKCRTPRGGYAFTRAWFLEHGLPYPPVPGWRQAVERGGRQRSLLTPPCSSARPAPVCSSASGNWPSSSSS